MKGIKLLCRFKIRLKNNGKNFHFSKNFLIFVYAIKYIVKMTRINSAIPVEHLTDEHLLAEHREIKRIPACFDKTDFSTLYRRIPGKFCLGPGHVTFFFDKLKFTYDRYLAIHAECLKRGFDVTNYSDSWFNVKNRIYFDYNWRSYKPTVEEKDLLIERISLRIMESPKSCFHYYGEPISKYHAIKLLTQDE